MLAVVAYLIGSIPFGLLIVRWVKGVDLRTVGSGNIGATNAGRVLGKAGGLGVLLLDALKGLLPTLVLARLCDETSATAVLAGTCAILGHMFPCWLGFRGGKGVATALGVVGVLAPWGTLAAFAAFALNFAATRIVSLGSVLAAIVFAVYQGFWLAPDWWSPEKRWLTVFSAAVPLLIILRHRSNLVRLLQGKEGAWKSTPAAPPPPEA